MHRDTCIQNKVKWREGGREGGGCSPKIVGHSEYSEHQYT